jgi:hypothetical protein
MKKILSLFSAAGLMLGLFSTAFAAADATAPSDVENVKVVAGDSKATLSWDVATDNVKVKGYKVYVGTASVEKAAGEYNLGAQDVGDVVSADVGNLENDTKYYFAVTAYDAAGNESKKYSVEVDATPKAGLSDKADAVAPTVIEAKATSKSEVEVEFSEAVKLPKTHPEQAFRVENQDTMELLDVLNAEIMKDADVTAGKEGKMVKLTTDIQKKDVSYILTATIDVTDLADNPIISGTSDTAVFKGSDAEPKASDAAGPQVSEVEFIDSTHLLVTFNESIVLGLNPSENFNVTLKDTPDSAMLEISEVNLGNDTKTGVKDASVVLTTGEMTADKTYVVTVTGVIDGAGNKVDPAKNSAEFTATEGSGGDQGGTGAGGGVTEDKTPPPDVSKFVAKVVKKDEALSVLLSWILPKDTDVALQKVYLSSDGKEYKEEASLDKALQEHSPTGLQAENEYWFKLTQVDAAGNESKGVLAKVKLSETGPELLGLLLVSAGLGRVFTRRKK